MFILLWQKKEPSAHAYMCWIEHDGNYHNLLTHTLDHQLYVGLNLIYLIYTIIPLSTELSIYITSLFLPIWAFPALKWLNS